MSRSTLKPIDGEALRKELKKRDLSFTDTSRNLGYSANIITTGIRQNKLSGAVIQALKLAYNIRPESYVIEEAASSGGVSSSFCSESTDWNKLSDIIYQAVYTAMHKALSE